jgi:disulfide bond formation protein DsbB
MTDLLGTRLTFAAIALGCATLLGVGYYLQFVDGLEPCPMCILQRVCYMTIAALALVAALHGAGRGGQRVYAALLGVPALLGLGVAARQTWLQHLPPEQVPECGPGLAFMLEMYAPFEVLKRTLSGTGDCAEVDWTFLGFSIAEWSVLCFAGLLLVFALQYRRATAALR